MINQENTSIIELAKIYPNLTITISYIDLLDVVRTVYHEEELKRESLLQDKNDEELLTVDQVIEILDISRASLWRWNRDKYLTSISIGRKVRYKKSDVEKILKNK